MDGIVSSHIYFATLQSIWIFYRTFFI